MENILIVKVDCLREIGKKIKKMEKENIFIQIKIFLKETIKKELNKDQV